MAVVVVPTVTTGRTGSSLRRVIDLPERGVVPAVRVPERVKDWLTAGVVVLSGEGEGGGGEGADGDVSREGRWRRRRWWRRRRGCSRGRCPGSRCR